MKQSQRTSERVSRGFTLIELLVVIAIIALLISIVLPSMGQARKNAHTVMCQSNLKQLGMAIQMYLDEQKDPQFFDMITNTGPFAGGLYQVGVVTWLQPYLNDAGNKPFDCPAARGLASVRDPVNIQYTTQGGRYYTAPLGATGSNISRYTEYWFNDSQPRFRGTVQTSGVAQTKVRLIKHPEWVVLATDAPDEFPRHVGKAAGRVTGDVNEAAANTGRNNFLFMDLRIKMLDIREYRPVEARDPYGASGPFYNWGHAYGS